LVPFFVAFINYLLICADESAPDFSIRRVTHAIFTGLPAKNPRIARKQLSFQFQRNLLHGLFRYLIYYVKYNIIILYIVCQVNEIFYYYIRGNSTVRLREILAYRLKEKRRKCGFSQAHLAEKVEVSTHHIGMIEIARDLPTLDLVERIADALDIEIYELFVAPASTHEELERLYQTVANNIERVVGEAIEKALTVKCKE
jgi:DNA-binding XRE family transcriptional regulator